MGQRVASYLQLERKNSNFTKFTKFIDDSIESQRIIYKFWQSSSIFFYLETIFFPLNAIIIYVT